MARVKWTGFETGDLDAEVDSVPGDAGYAMAATAGAFGGYFTAVPTPRTGDYCFAGIVGAGANQRGIGSWVLPSALAELYFRFALYVPEFKAAVTEYPSFFTFMDGSSGGQIRLGYDPNTQRVKAIRGDAVDSHLGHNQGGSVIATGTYVLQDNEWTLFEGYLKVDDSVGVLQLRVRGVTDPLDIDFSGDTQGQATANVEIIRFGVDATATLGYEPIHYLDDIAVNDTTGSYQNTWPGPGGIYYLKPNGAGSVAAWSPSTAGVDNWTMVDEVPADDDTTYVYDDTSGHQDLYNIESLADTVDRVWMIAPCFTGALNAAGTVEVIHLYREGGTTYQKGTQTLSQETYKFYLDDPVYTHPGTAVYFTPAQIASTETGMEVA